MKINTRPVLPLLVCLLALGLGLAFTAPAEARSGHHRNYYKSAYNCPTHGRDCNYNYRAGYKGQGGPCAYYDRYHRGGDYASYGHKGNYRNQGNYYRGHNYRGHH